MLANCLGAAVDDARQKFANVGWATIQGSSAAGAGKAQPDVAPLLSIAVGAA